VNENAYQAENGVNIRNSQTHMAGNLEWTTLENNVIQDFHSNTPIVVPASIANSNVTPA
jgi:hypothetical protein